MSRTAAAILVRPFRSLSDDAEHAYFARGFLDDLFTELSYVNALELRAEGAAEGSVDYELQGSIRPGANRVRVNAQLLEVGTGRHLWAGRFDAAMDDAFAAQDEIASSVAGSLATHVDGLRLERARRSPVTSLAAYDLWLRGRECLERGSVEADLEADLEARDLEELARRGPFDVVLIVEALHDMSHPDEVLRGIRESLAPGGVLIVVDERVADEFSPTAGDAERMMYGWSVVHCLPVGVAEQRARPIGIVIRSSAVQALAEETGYARFEILPIEHEQFRFYRLSA